MKYGIHIMCLKEEIRYFIVKVKKVYFMFFLYSISWLSDRVYQNQTVLKHSYSFDLNHLPWKKQSLQSK